MGLPQAAPKGGVQQDNVDQVLSDGLRQLFKVDHNRIGGRGDGHELAQAAHTLQPPAGVFEIIVVQIKDRAAHMDRFFHCPDGIGINPQTIGGKGCGQGAVNFNLMRGGKDAGFQLVGGEAVFGFQVDGMGHDLVRRGFTASPRGGIAVAKEQVGCKGNFLAQRAAQQVASADAQALARRIHTGHLDRCVQLRAGVVQAAHGVHDLPAQLFQLQRVVAKHIGL